MFIEHPLDALAVRPLRCAITRRQAAFAGRLRGLLCK
jgi:hypothetical protein